MIETIKNKKPSKDPTRKIKVGGLSLSSLTKTFTKPDTTPGALKATKQAPKQDSVLARLFGKKSTDAKATKQEASMSRDKNTQKRSQISTKQKQKEGEEAQATTTKEKVQEQKVELTKAAKSKVSDLFSNPEFKLKIEGITGKKADSFGKKPTDAEVKTEVTTKMDSLKATQRTDAEVEAARKRDATLAESKKASEAKKGFLKQKLDEAKARLQERLDGLFNPAKRQQIKEQRMKDDARRAREDANVAKGNANNLRKDAEIKEKNAREARKRADEETDPAKKNDLEVEAKNAEANATKARDSANAAKQKANTMRRTAFEKETKAKGTKEGADDINNPRNRNDVDNDPELKKRLDEDAEAAEAYAKKARGDAKKARGDATRLENDAKVKEQKAREARKRANEETDPELKKRLDKDAEDAEVNARRARQDAESDKNNAKKMSEDAEVQNRKAREAKEKAKRTKNPEEKMDPPKRDRVNEERVRNKAQKAKEDADINFKKKNKFKDSLKDFLKKIIGLLLQIGMMLLPYLKILIPSIELPGGPGTGNRDPTEIVFPIQDIGEPPPPPPREEEEEEEEEEAPPPEEAEPEESPEGAITFTLKMQPEEDISFKLESLSDYLEFSESVITFPVESWDTPVYVNFTTSLETTPEEDDEYNDLSTRNIVEEGEEGEESEEDEEDERLKKPSIYKETEPTVEQLVAHRTKLNVALKKPKTLKERLEEVQRRVSLRQMAEQYGGETKVIEELVEPTYDDEYYKPYETEVIPSIHVKIKHDEDDFIKPVEEHIEPTYEDGYESAHETVVPTIEGGQEDNNSEANNSEENVNIEDLDYAKLTSEIDGRNLSENLKGEFKLTLYQDITYSIDLAIEVDSDIWTIEPSTLNFSGNDAEQNSFFFSQIVYDSLKESYAQSKGEKLGEKYLNSAQKEYDEGMEEVEKEEAEAEEEANAVYDNTYEESMNNTNEKIQNAENILEELEGGAIPKTYFLNKFKNRTHKLR